MKLKWLASAALAASLLAPATAVHAATPAYARLSWDGGGDSLGTAIMKNGTVYVPANTLESAGMTVRWDKSRQRADYAGYGRSLAVRIGGTSAVLDGDPVRGMPAPFLYQGQLYLSGRFVVAALEGDSVAWDAKTRVFSAKHLHTYAGFSQTYGGRTYSVVKRTGELFASTGKNGAQVKLADLGSQLYDGVSMEFQPTEGGLLLLTITDNYGEPHLNDHRFALLLKNGAVIRQADVHYWQRFEKNVAAYGDHLLLTDGQTLRVIRDGTGAVEQTIDLVKLGGEDGPYFVEGAADDYLLIRPNASGLLTLVDRTTGASVKLYKQLLDAEGQAYATENDVPYHGDELHFVKRDGDTLYFEDDSPFAKDSGRLLPYKLPIPAEGGTSGP
ncbi:copper amine oxidase N-terminal domain-containing protein [Paenibacillus sp. MWE-103]|uniref:Copper amine oxidase N-terminal domain-containing protein n=1 Tax=Paenibacillus artemisiicola TaxID=1172618 RepID=A0ABS3WEY9_9BACL|nr:copper amine oxidase N-terminal domain-containing protein [Paenibacillus artemisiicola]MBO7746874.1 copper amine oxidase N-terminal domain-containing protein [Paenibacillus artemisiicola]